MGPPLVAATIAAVIAFLTVKISKVPMVQDFGVLLSIGIVALLIAGIVVPTTLIGARERRSPTTEEPVESWVEATVDRLGSLPACAVLPLVLVALALPVLGLVLETGSRIESDPINWANQSSTSIKNARMLEEETGFATTLGVFIETDSAPSNGVFTDQMGAFVFDLVERSTAENPELAGASSLPTTVGWLAEVPGTTPLAADRSRHARRRTTSLRRRCSGLLVADDGNATQVLFQVGPSSLEERADRARQRATPRSLDPGDGALLPAQASATTGGLAVVGVGLLENITANRAQLTIVALLLVARVRRAALSRPRSRAADDDPGARRGGHVGGAREGARHHPEPAVDRRRAAGRRDVRRVLRAADRPLCRGTRPRARPGGEHADGRAANRPGVLHLGADDARWVRGADVLVAAAARRLRHGRHDQHRRRLAVGARRGAAAGEGG